MVRDLLRCVRLIKLDLSGRVAGSPGRRVAGSPGRRVAGSRYLRPRDGHGRSHMARTVEPFNLFT